MLQRVPVDATRMARMICRRASSSSRCVRLVRGRSVQMSWQLSTGRGALSACTTTGMCERGAFGRHASLAGELL